MAKSQLNMLALIFSLFASAEAWARQSQLHLRVGQVTGSYNGTFNGDFEVGMAFDFDYELFVANDGAVIFRFTQAIDTPSSRPFYTYAGTGFRHYLQSKGPSREQKDKNVTISARPRLRYYIGLDAGIAQVIVKSFGPNVQSVANLAELGANVGAIYQLNDRFGFEAHLGASMGYGISSTPTNGNTERILIGTSYYF